MEFSDYANHDGINATALKAGRQSMLAMRAVMAGENRKDSPAMQWGRKVHTAVLEPGVFHDTTRVIEAKSKRVKAWTEAVEEYGVDACLLPAEAEALVRCIECVHGNRHAAEMIDHCKTEQSLFWDDDVYGAAKARIDILGGGVMADLKTTTTIDADTFARQSFNLGYPLQFAWYKEAARRSGELVDCFVIALTNTEPFDCRVFSLDSPEFLSLMDRELRTAEELAARYRACEKEQYWPGVSSTIDALPVPAWALQEEWEVE